jgi:hypothetical protein
MKGDGLAKNVWILRSIVRHCQKGLKPLFVSFVDVKKAFDSVSRHTILSAAARLGVPDLLLSYIRSVYEGDSTRLKPGARLSREIRAHRGVKQGTLCLPYYLMP